MLKNSKTEGNFSLFSFRFSLFFVPLQPLLRDKSMEIQILLNN